jgi:hypothetical protein
MFTVIKSEAILEMYENLVGSAEQALEYGDTQGSIHNNGSATLTLHKPAPVRSVHLGLVER